ncbi:MAG: 2Fe-2S iron-sulfur cluster binding domain-containing protein [Gemmatimonadales bacterium]|nr:2Fe-2S iron-sulfur cluster binding domain-containing protein [Gemmatimonadales bacterium]NIN10188.1 2Fe-2S iron-sulfur cluster binding domain-containing protein [Gemmatimonadales bacterium]NIN48944.1 2Fe-2S iron-sulfur cluster binding domain-containing protein [Gemmatimonadales bacterium]NIP06408.1 2Fe-2S iron-sulfur cluster binding domain-containing protein [Gemmatimonadales bacterium]NIQ98760.1 2Fe-2S iron-sulfur cluster binding domain-containing protein [Gemmatimonadales bacterium]
MARDRNDHTDEPGEGGRGLSRRGFLTSMGTGALSVAAATQVSAEAVPQAEVLAAEELSKVKLRVNGHDRELLVEPRWSLAYVLRDELGLTGTKVSCDRGECGACTVLINGVPRYACITLAVEAEGAEVTTVEGLMEGEELGTVQQAFLERDAFQCGYCTSGQIMAVEGLLRANPNPSIEEIRRHMAGNLCRCGTYPHIFMAAQRASELKGSSGGAS